MMTQETGRRNFLKLMVGGAGLAAGLRPQETNAGEALFQGKSKAQVASELGVSIDQIGAFDQYQVHVDFKGGIGNVNAMAGTVSSAYRPDGVANGQFTDGRTLFAVNPTNYAGVADVTLRPEALYYPGCPEPRFAKGIALYDMLVRDHIREHPDMPFGIVNGNGEIINYRFDITQMSWAHIPEQKMPWTNDPRAFLMGETDVTINQEGPTAWHFLFRDHWNPNVNRPDGNIWVPADAFVSAWQPGLEMTYFGVTTELTGAQNGLDIYKIADATVRGINPNNYACYNKTDAAKAAYGIAIFEHATNNPGYSFSTVEGKLVKPMIADISQRRAA